MHKSFDRLTIEGISKTEGHASLDIKFKGKEVEYVHLKIEENRRFYKKAALGKNILALNQSLSRICGTCSAAHQFATLKTIENALDLEVSEEEIIMRKLLYYGNMIRDHGMHLYLFSLPDVFGYESILDFTRDYANIIKEGFKVQEVGAKLSMMIGGRAIHQLNISLRGFSTHLSKEELEGMIRQLKIIRKPIISLITTYKKWDASLIIDELQQGALKNNDFGFLEGSVIINGKKVESSEYLTHITAIWKDYSHSHSYLYDSKPYMLGALARLNINKANIHNKTKKYLPSIFPSNNIFHNNLAQAIEMLHCIDASIEILEKLLERGEIKPYTKSLPSFTTQTKGYGIIEAPRGLLYYHFLIDEKGSVKDVEIITPTAQNHAHMEMAIKQLIEENKDVGRSTLTNMIETLIRAYDPCFSCASHFLRVKWL